MATLILIGSVASVGCCVIWNKFGWMREERAGSASEKRRLVVSNRQPIRSPYKEEDGLSTIVEGSEDGRLSSRPQSENLDDGRKTPHSQQLDDGQSEGAAESTAALTQTGSSKDEEYFSGIDALSQALLDIEDGEDEEMITAKMSFSSSVFQELENGEQTAPSSISIYEASKSQLKEQVSADELKFYMDPVPPPSSRQSIHESLKYGFVIDGVLSPVECAKYVQLTEEIGYTKWTKDEARLAFRDCDTIEVNHPELAHLLWTRIEPLMQDWEKDCAITFEDDPERWQRDLEGRWIADGTVHSVLFSRYLDGGHFAVHTDGFNVETFDRRSLYSIVLYLNDVPDGEGGETIFFSNEAQGKMAKDSLGRIIGDPAFVVAKVKPRAGTATVFFHNILHQSEPIRVGSDTRKYIIRSDVMYSRTPPLVTTQNDADAFSMYQKAELLSDSDPEESARLFRGAFKKSPLLCRIYGM